MRPKYCQDGQLQVVLCIDKHGALPWKFPRKNSVHFEEYQLFHLELIYQYPMSEFPSFHTNKSCFDNDFTLWQWVVSTEH